MLNYVFSVLSCVKGFKPFELLADLNKAIEFATLLDFDRRIERIKVRQTKSCKVLYEGLSKSS